MIFNTYKRRPFVVQAVQITPENIEECAELIGEVGYTPEGEAFIRVNKRIVPNINRAYAGWWITRMEDNLRCYNPKVFVAQFEPVGTVTNVFQLTTSDIGE